VPPRLLNEGGRSKGLVRRSLARRFPDLGFERHRKVHATDFFGSTLATEGIQAWREIPRSGALARVGIADRQGLADQVERLATHGRGVDLFNLWHLLSVEAWLQPRT
jgi:hypothetical protein